MEDWTQPDELIATAARAAARVIRAGQFAPAFRLEDIHGGVARMVDLIEQGPLVISFYRGVWCDYCAYALDALAEIDCDVRAWGANQVAIGPGPSDEDQKQRLLAFPMPILVDVNLRVAKSYGLTIALPTALRGRYRALGCRPAGDDWRVPIPATYVVDRTGRVALATIDPDYRNRLSPNQILSALRCLSAKTYGPLQPEI